MEMRWASNLARLLTVEATIVEHIGWFCSCEGKYCNGCQRVKCHRAFGKGPTGNTDGLYYRCKECCNTYQKLYREQRRLYSKRQDHSELAYRGSNVDQYVSNWSFQHIGLFCNCSGLYLLPEAEQTRLTTYSRFACVVISLKTQGLSTTVNKSIDAHMHLLCQHPIASLYSTLPCTEICP